MQPCYLGIDTSCYTTSVAILGSDGQILTDERMMLEVKTGNRGLRQSEMVYQHTRNLPLLLNNTREIFRNNKLCAIGVSSKPPDLSHSFMPAFLVGLGAARSLQAVLNIPHFEISHQRNHVLAGLRSLSAQPDELIVVHLSGGTTEALHIGHPCRADYTSLELGASSDIAAGQFIDRLGIAMGLSFPAGQELEHLAKNGKVIDKYPVRLVAERAVSFSGWDTKLRNYVRDSKYSYADIACTALDIVARSVVKLVERHLASHPSAALLMVGGVASNGYIVDIVRTILAGKVKEILVAERKYCPDNATGAAWYALLQGGQSAV